MKLKKTKLVGFIGVIAVTVQMFLLPTSAKAADSSHYEMKGWKMGVVGNTASINFGFIGSDGASLVSTQPIPLSMVAGHENDPSWTGYDSAAPILAYIKQYGINSNIIESMNATCYDPSIFQSLAAQGVNLSQLGGPNAPPGSTPPADLVGKANYGSNIGKVLVGVGVPAPDLSGFLGTASKSTSTSKASSPLKVTATTNPTPTAPAPIPSSSSTASVQNATPKQATSTPKVTTNLNPVPQAQETAAASKTDPQRTDPPIMALQDKTQTKIESPSAQNSQSKKTPWAMYAEIGGSGILALGLITFVKLKYFKA
ncbi:hypothetical protein Desaci_1401 [Desulfosporosinus acidiphilus SJ4]|uniref:Uncharacterized protein n=1 Tax=Desulfosporosinus acidiphilus (strain DSM 22704 / JCM 16185 / SJ4) TaxID=646529 RepID=I4D3Q0_DESAJ|nr:hypothetical protein [Desulfosporosinus acidiphilus]AFM40424.1 hypothetical protein Desaci_1401 [Desulfosporosinus acidiphilus SJ4]